MPALEDAPLLEWLRKRSEVAEITMSVCSGSALLAKAGLLDGLRATSNKQFFDLADGRELGTAPSSTTVTHGVTVSPDGRYAFVSVEGVGAEPGKVDVFDLNRFVRVADLEVGQQAGGIVFWKMEEARPPPSFR